MEDTKSNPAVLPNTNSSNTQILLAVGIVVVLLLIAVAAFLFTKKNDDDTIAEKDGQAEIEAGVEVNRTGLEVFETDDYVFGYPKDWKVEEDSIVFVYSIDPEEQEAGEFNDNVNIVSQAAGMKSISKSECKELGEQIAKTLSSTYDTAKLEGTEKKKINGIDTCVTKYTGELSGVSIKQEQYFFADKSTGDVYIITTSLANGDTNAEKALSIVNTFEIK